MALQKSGSARSKNHNRYLVTELESRVVLSGTPPAGSFFADLWAGKNSDVGNVYVWNDEDNIHVQFQIIDATPTDPTDNYYLTQTDVHIGDSLSDIPQKNGNPIPGKFAFKNDHDYVTEYCYTIPIDTEWECDETLFVAAHANVEIPAGLKGLELALPNQVTITNVVNPGTGYGSPSYWDTTIENSAGSFLDGTYDGWCIDTDHVIYSNTNYTANVYSSYEALPVGMVEYPQNLDSVNWVLNQDFVGKSSPGGYGNYTYGDVQRAIWDLIEDNTTTAGIGSFNQSRVDEIVNAALITGNGFVPGCDDDVAIIVQPVNATGNTVAQVTILEANMGTLGIPCDATHHSAWAGDKDFSGKNWARYFNYTLECGDSMVAAASADADSQVPELTMDQLQSAVREGIIRWSFVLQGDLPVDLEQVNFTIDDLPGDGLGYASDGAITIDSTAAGFGWFVDSSPWEDSEFLLAGNQGEADRIDLLSVVMHELGHVLGLDHSVGGVMHESIEAGTRIATTRSEVPLYFGDVPAEERQISIGLDSTVRTSSQLPEMSAFSSEPMSPANETIPRLGSHSKRTLEEETDFLFG